MEERPVKTREKFFKGKLKGFLATALFMVLALAMTYPLVLHMSDNIPMSLGDPYYNIWVMSWNRHAVIEGGENILDTNIFYPHKRTLYFADPLFLETVLNSVLSLFWKNPIFSYNILLLLSFVLCGVGMYCLVYHLTGSWAASLFAGLVYSYFPNKFAHLAHLEMLFYGWMPLVFLFLHKFYKKPEYKNLAGFTAFFILQAASCSYYAVYITLFSLLFILYFSYQKGFFLRKDFWLKMVLSGLVIFLVLSPLFFPYIQLSRQMSFERSLNEVKFYSARLQNFLSVPIMNLIWGRILKGRDILEWQIFPGLLPLLLSLYWWLKTKKPKRRFTQKQRMFRIWDYINIFFLLFVSWIVRSGGFSLAISGKKWLSVHSLRNPLIVLGLSVALRFFFSRKQAKKRLKNFFRIPLIKRLGPKSQPDKILSQKFYIFIFLFTALLVLGPVITIGRQEIIEGPYYLLYLFFPGFNGLRVPPRFTVILMLGLAVLSAWGVVEILKRKSSPARKVGVPLLMGLVLAAEFISIPIPLVRAKKQEEIPPIYSTVKELPEGSAILKYPMPRFKQYRMDAPLVYYSIYHRKRLVNGYSGYFPPGYKIIREAMESFPSAETLDLLESLEVDYVLVQTGSYRPYKAKFAVERLAEYPGRAELVEQNGNNFLYHLLPQEKKVEGKENLEPVGNQNIWTAEANHRPDHVQYAFDRNLETRWDSGYHQREGDYFSLDLGERLRVQKMELYIWHSSLDFPRGYRLEGSVDGANWTLLDEKAYAFPALSKANIQDFTQHKVEISFEETEVRYLKVSLTRFNKSSNWSIHEIILY